MNLKLFSNILTSDCKVVKFKKNFFVYPIFKNGSSSITDFAKEKKLEYMTNSEIQKIDQIHVYLRDPIQRFVSGVHTYFYLAKKKINIPDLEKIGQCELLDKHFIPQYMWIMHLRKFFNGKIKICPFQDILNLVPNRAGPWRSGIPWKDLQKNEKNQILKFANKEYITIDNFIIKQFMNTTIDIQILIQNIRDALPKN